MCHGWSGALFRRRAHQREEIYPIKIPVIRHEVVDMVFICGRGMERIRKQQSILPRDPERIVQNVRGLKDSEVVLFQYFPGRGIWSVERVQERRVLLDVRNRLPW